jgi:hypothetical protein
MLMPSTPLEYPQVASRRLASFHVVDSTVSAAKPIFGTGSIPGSSTENKLVRA